MTRSIIVRGVLLMSIAVCLPAAAQAQPFVDDFEDGNVEDGKPVTWLPLPTAASGLRYVADGSYVLEPQSADVNVISSSYVADRVFSDVSLRSQVRWLGSANSYSGFGLTARLSPSITGWNGYIGGIGSDGLLFITELVDGDEQLRAERQSLLNPIVSDVHLQFDTIGTSLSLFAWQDGTPQPAQPQLRYVDNSNASGMVGFGMRPSTNRAPVALRHYSAIPEPSAAVMATVALLGLAFRRRRAAR